MNRNPESVLGTMLNLECAAGHRYFSPQPTRWLGKTCAPYRTLETRCTYKLRLIPRAKR